MSDRFHVGTRKGVFSFERRNGEWALAAAEHLGDPVPIVLSDTRSGTLYAAIDHGHFGGKLHRRPADGGEWEEIGVPTYPEQPAGVDSTDASGKDIAWSLKLIWALAAGHPDQPGRLWCGTLPGGLFRSDDGGASWELVRSLWDHPGRREWMGAGSDWPGIHSVCVHPRRADRLTLVMKPGSESFGMRDGWPSAKQWVVPGSREVGW